MHRARWTPDGIELVEAEPGPIPDGWVRLQVTGCGICGSDLHVYRGMREGRLQPTEYAVPGHEIAGTLLAGTPGMDDVVYAVEPWVNCRDCAPCVRGDITVCESGQLLGISIGGGLASVVDVPRRLLHRSRSRAAARSRTP
ncbi:MAG: alcohol dehydrogenase catalytic domain-containing protein [Actinomycetota bacterium]